MSGDNLYWPGANVPPVTNLALGSTTTEGENGAVTSIHDVLAGRDFERDVLVVGPAMTGKQRIGLELLAGVFASGGLPFCITTSDPAPEIRERFAAYAPDEDVSLAVVDCLAEMQGRDVDDEWTQTVPTPADLTGIGMALSQARRNLGDDVFEGGRLLLDSITATLMYADEEPVYRFLHDLTGQFEQLGGHTIATLDTDAIDGSQEQSITGLFDVAVETRRGNSGPTEFQVRGDVVDTPSRWYEYEPDRPGGDR